MSLFPLGLISQGGGGNGGNALTLISTQVLASTASSVTFSSIPSSFTHLQLRTVARTSASQDSDSIIMRVNSDSGSNYSQHYLYGNGSSVTSTNYINAPVLQYPWAAGATAASGVFASSITDILDYANTNKYKTARLLHGMAISAGNYRIELDSGVWRSTSAITSITLTLSTGPNFAVGSRFSLYGVS